MCAGNDAKEFVSIDRESAGRGTRVGHRKKKLVSIRNQFQDSSQAVPGHTDKASKVGITDDTGLEGRPETELRRRRSSDVGRYFASVWCAVGGNSGQRTRVPRGSARRHASFPNTHCPHIFSLYDSSQSTSLHHRHVAPSLNELARETILSIVITHQRIGDQSTIVPSPVLLHTTTRAPFDNTAPTAVSSGITRVCSSRTPTVHLCNHARIRDTGVQSTHMTLNFLVYCRTRCSFKRFCNLVLQRPKGPALKHIHRHFITATNNKHSNITQRETTSHPILD